MPALANDVSIDVKDILVTAGVGTFAATTGWGIYISQEPAAPPDTTVTIYTMPVAEPHPRLRIDTTGVQIRVRGAPKRYEQASVKAEEVKDALLGLPRQTVNNTLYVGVWATTDVIFLRYDENRRPILVSNWRIVREPAESTYRLSPG